MLALADILPLRNADLEAGKIDLFDRSLFPAPESAGVLVGKGLVERDGTLTEEGMKIAKALDRKLEVLKEGIPARKRLKPWSLVIKRRTTGWVYGHFKKNRWISNGEAILYVSKVPEWANAKMASEKVKSLVRKRLAWIIDHIDEFKRCDEVLWQVPSVGVDDVLWFKGSDKWLYKEVSPITSCIKAMYVDFCRKRYEGCVFYLPLSGHEKFPMIVRVGAGKTRYFGKGLVGVIAQVKREVLETAGRKENGRKDGQEVQD